MKSMKRQIGFLSVLMVLMLIALTLGGLQLFGKGKAQPSNWFKKSDTPQAEEVVPESSGEQETIVTASVLRSTMPMANTLEKFPTANKRYVEIEGMFGALCCAQVPSYRSNLSDSGAVAYMDIDAVQPYSYYVCIPKYPSSHFGLSEDYVFESIRLYTSSHEVTGFTEYSDYYVLGFPSTISTNIYCEMSFKIDRTPVPLPENPIKEGHKFVGWYYGTQEQHGTSCRAYDGEPIYADTDLHAHFQINTYAVTFVTAGGSEVENLTVDWNTSITLPETTLVGYNFLGWYYSTGVKYTNQPIKENITLIAHWDIKRFTVTFYVDDTVYSEKIVEYGNSLESVMKEAELQSYQVMTMEGERLSKQNSIITEDTQVLVRELTGWEKYGDFVARNQWYTWTTVGVMSLLLMLSVVGMVGFAKKR